MTILAAVEGKHIPSRIVALGHTLAVEFDEPLVVLHVGTESQTEDDAKFIAEDIAINTVGNSDRVEIRGRTGDPDEEILAEAEQTDPRYVLTGGRRRSAVGKAVFGSTSQSILLNSPSPVLAIPRDGVPIEELHSGPIVAAVDRSDWAKSVVSEAKTLADALNCELHVLHVFPTKEWLKLHRDRIESTGTEGVDKSVVQESAHKIAKSTGREVTADFTPVGRVGDPSNGILSYAREVDASYVAVGGRKVTPIGKVLFGSVTQSVILNLDRPVLTTLYE